MKWMTTCREATELASRAMDESLSMRERVAMRMHLKICKNCRRFAEQIQQMRRLFSAEIPDDSSPGLSDDARRRIETELQNKLDP